ncbi:MAG: hypothetical protein VX945_02750, partial [Verrucomicrobiota bacterium]|nr:hypothetical protein [Verrucomicrobiota bacterium]
LMCVALGCRTIGPASLQQTHPQYNHAISQSMDEQFLLNLVRLKYRDNPFFLEVSSVTSQQSVQSDVGTSLKLIRGGDTLTPSTGLTYKETPTISYSPLRGDQFLKQILSPVPLEAVLILTQSGWSVERVVNVCVERVNGLDNASNASGPTPSREPRYERFKEMAEILRELQVADALELGAAPCDPGAKGSMQSGHDLVLRLKPQKALAKGITRLQELLGVKIINNELRLTNNFLNRPENGLAVRTRSMMGIFFYLSHNAEVPASHLTAGLVTQTKGKNETPFDWNKVTGGLFRVRSAEVKPVNPFVAVPYRGNWFYIADNDLESKSTFMLLTQLFNLQAGQIKTVAPALTIGVGG